MKNADKGSSSSYITTGLESTIKSPDKVNDEAGGQGIFVT